METALQLETGIVRTSDENGLRWYRVGDKSYVSVTAVLDNWTPPALKRWFKNNSAKEIEKKSSDTAKQGSNIHALAADGKEERLNALCDRLKLQILDKEVVEVSKAGFAGQRDILGVIDGKKYILDIKTGFVGPQAFVQCAAYAMAAAEKGHDIHGVGVIKLPRDLDQPAEFLGEEDFEGCQYAWCAIFDYFKFMNREQLKDWEFFNNRTVLSYNWGPK